MTSGQDYDTEETHQPEEEKGVDQMIAGGTGVKVYQGLEGSLRQKVNEQRTEGEDEEEFKE